MVVSSVTFTVDFSFFQLRPVWAVTLFQDLGGRSRVIDRGKYISVT